MTVVVVSGTGTEVGKTIVTAAIAAVAMAAGRRVCVVKPAQTGVGDGDEADVEVVKRLSGALDVHELARYPDPLAPATAARRAQVSAVPVTTMIERIRALHGRDLILVEGAGGLLVRLDDDGSTVADLARGLAARVIVVAAAGLGTLNATALTCEAVRNRGLECAGVVVGAWPSKPDLAALSNLDDFEVYAAAPLLGVIPAGAGAMDRLSFLQAATRGLSHPRWADLGCPRSRLVSALPQRNEGPCS